MVQVLSQLNPIMQQLAGVNLSTFLQDISKLPAAVGDNLGSTEKPSKPGGSKPGGDPFPA